MSSFIGMKSPLKDAAWCCSGAPRDANFTYNWSIENFKSVMHTYKCGELIYSSNFEIKVGGKEAVWKLRCDPNGTREEDTGYVCLYLCPVNKEAKNATVELDFALVKKDGSRVSVVNIKKKDFKEVTNGWGPSRFISHTMLKSDDSLLPGNCFGICCNILVYGCGSKMEVVSSGTNWVFSSTFDAVEVGKGDGHSLQRRLTDLLHSGDFADAEIVCDDATSLPCHKNIVASASPVFKGMFMNDMKERKTGKIVIKGIDKDTLADMLLYIYGGKIDEMENKAVKLLEVAERYILGQLKEHCEMLLVSDLKLDNCLDYLVTADLHSANLLRSAALKFMVDNAEELERKVDWKDTLVNFPQILVEFTQGVLLSKMS
jgi:hypothetical protein